MEVRAFFLSGGAEILTNGHEQRRSERDHWSGGAGLTTLSRRGARATARASEERRRGAGRGAEPNTTTKDDRR